jgi:hypothetical protein
MTTSKKVDYIEKGVLLLGFKGLDDMDLKRILLKLASGRERRPRKCQRLDGVQAHISRLSSSTKIWKINLVGNKAIGDEGTTRLHLISDTLRDLDLSHCNLTLEGIKNVCKYLEMNTTITRMVMGGNEMDDEAAELVGKMLAINTTLEEIVIYPGENHVISHTGCFHLCSGLLHNKTLRTICLNQDDSCRITHEGKSLIFALLCEWNTTIECVSIGSCLGSASASFSAQVYEQWRKTLLYNESLKSLHCGAVSDRHVRYWLDLNSCNARKIVRNQNDYEWIEAVVQAAEDNNRNAIYFFVRNRPEICFCRRGAYSN